jgi:hypothetical protein
VYFAHLGVMRGLEDVLEHMSKTGTGDVMGFWHQHKPDFQASISEMAVVGSKTAIAAAHAVSTVLDSGFADIIEKRLAYDDDAFRAATEAIHSA